MDGEDGTPNRIGDIEEQASIIEIEQQRADISNYEGKNEKDDEGMEWEDEEREKSMSVEKSMSAEKSMSVISDVFRSSRFLLLLRLMAIAIDPLFFYVPMMKIKSSTCLGLDKTLMIVVIILRTCVDILHDWSWWSYWRPYVVSRSPRLARVMAIIASLPLPQMIVLLIDLELDLNKWLKVGVICQFIPRILRIYPMYVPIASDFDRNALVAAGFNLLLFVLASHVVGGIWYLRAVDRQFACMREACRAHLKCTKSSLYCKSGNYADNRFINGICSAEQTLNARTPFDYGLSSNAIKSNLIGSTSFIVKIVHGFWWGLRNLSSMGTNLDFNDSIGDTSFAILICILGLTLLAVLIGNFQVYMQSRMPHKLAKKMIKMEKKEEALRKWGPFSSLPSRLRKEVRQCKHPRWLEVSEVNIESLLNDLPWDLRRELRRHFCKNLFEKMKEFEDLKYREKKYLRSCAEPVVYQAGVKIHKKGSPINKMIHIIDGTVSIYNDNENREDKELTGGASFGSELLSSALKLDKKKHPNATQTVKSDTKVEAFAISSDDIADLRYFGSLFKGVAG